MAGRKKEVSTWRDQLARNAHSESFLARFDLPTVKRLTISSHPHTSHNYKDKRVISRHI